MKWVPSMISGLLAGTLLLGGGCTPPSRLPVTIPADPPVVPSPKADSRNSDRLQEILGPFQSGIELLERGNPQGAADLFASLVLRYPDVAVFHINLGVAYKRLDRRDEAIASYRKAIQLDGGLPEAHYNLAILYREQGEFATAEESYRESLRLDPSFREAYYNLAILYDLYLNRPETALECYRKYLELGGDRPEEIRIWMAALEKRLDPREDRP
jgi:Flp pilus assembly protein TadD